MTTGSGVPEAAPTATYGCEAIQVLEGLEPVRRRPGMYIGDTHDGSGLHRLVVELVANVLAEHLEGRCHHLVLTLHAGGALSVEDDGPGIPVDAGGAPDRQKSTLEVMLTSLLSWRRARGSRVRHGLQGLGLGCVNALCEALVVEVRRGGLLHRQTYSRGRPLGPVACLGPARGTGTRITIHPDPLIFTGTAFDLRRITETLRPIAFLDPGLRIEIADERRGARREVFFARSIADWTALLTEGQAGFPEAPLRLWVAGAGLTVDLALRWTGWPWTRVRAFADHEEVQPAAPLQGLAQGVKHAASELGLGGAHHAFRRDALQRGLAAVFDIRGPAVESVGACHNKLGAATASEVRRLVAASVAEELRRDPALLRTLAARSG